VSDDLAVTLSIMKESGYWASVFLVNNEQGYFKAIEQLARHKIDVYHIPNIDAISKYATRDVYY
jgi:hypothetical protein